MTVLITTNCRKFSQRWEYQTTLSTSWETCILVDKQQLEPDMEKWTGSKLGKEYVQAIYCHSACLTYVQSTSCKMLDWMKFKPNQDRQYNVNNLRYAEDTTLMAESEKGLKSLLMKVKEESEKAGLKLSIQKTKTMASSPIPLWQIGWGTMEAVTVYFPGLRNHCR